jgi:VanZ family protein
MDLLHKLHADKLVHAFLFFVLCFLCIKPIFTITNKTKTQNIWFVLIAIVGSLYGIAIEFIQQAFIANRAFDIYDIVADIVGCAIALVVGIKKIGLNKN